MYHEIYLKFISNIFLGNLQKENVLIAIDGAGCANVSISEIIIDEERIREEE